MQGEEVRDTAGGRMSAVGKVGWAGRTWPRVGSHPFSPPFFRTWWFSWTNW